MELFLDDVEAADPGRSRVADLVFIDCLPTLIRRSDDSATSLGLALWSCELLLEVATVLILFALALALSPKRPGRLLLLPALKADDFDLTPSLPVDAALTEEEGGVGGFAAVEEDEAAVEGLPATTFLGLFIPVLLLLAVVALLARCNETTESEGSLDIIGGLGGRAEVNF